MLLRLSDIPAAMRQQWLQHAIAPRPIGLVSTINASGQANLAPFSFFNLFSSAPPIVVFSPARRVRDNTEKHTLQNVREVPEAVIHIVDYNMVQQTSLASCEYAAGIDEFIKAGFSKEKARFVLPPMVKESPVKLECKVLRIEPLGTEGGAGNLIITEVICMHIDDSILNDTLTMIDQERLQHVARLGGDWYCKVDASNLFKVPKPNISSGIGFDALPDEVLHSEVLTGNELAMLANVAVLPERSEHISSLTIRQRHLRVKELLKEGRVEEAWTMLL